MAKLLVVDREGSVLEVLRDCFQDAGYAVVTAENGREALVLFYQQQPDLVITDTRTPGISGLELVGRIREVSQAPIIILSAVEGEREKIHALRLGAYQYLVKPVGMPELLARVEAALRRAPPSPSLDHRIYSDSVVSIDTDSHRTYVRGSEVPLAPKEFQLLACLMERDGEVLHHEELLNRVWGFPARGQELKWHIASLRQKIEQDPHDPKLIITIWGSGYRYGKPIRSYVRDASAT